jgi:hypothetical protein
MIMEDCGEDTLTLKELVREGKATLDIADEIGTSMGQFLGSLHGWGRKNPDDILGMFKGNEQAIKMSAWVTYGCVVSTLNGTYGLPALSDPPISISERDLEIIAKVASDMGHAMTTAREFVSTQAFCRSVLSPRLVRDGRLLAGEHNGCLGRRWTKP